MFENNLFGKTRFRIIVYPFEVVIFQLSNYFQPIQNSEEL